MKKIHFLFLALLLLFSLPTLAQPDSDGDGISDAEDMCPSLKGVKSMKGCPEEKKTAPPFITQEQLENILAGICDNSIQKKLYTKPVVNKFYGINLPNTGIAGNLPVYYKQVTPLNYHLLIGLSEKLADSTEAVRYINEALAKSNACNGLFKSIRLGYSPSGKCYTDVTATNEGGIFFYLEKARPAGKTILQLRIYKINYAETQKKETAKPSEPAKPVNDCADLQTILDECINGFKKSKGSFVRQDTPAKYYTTTLPDLGLADRYVVESLVMDVVNDEFVRNAVIYYSAEKTFTEEAPAIRQYELLRDRVKKCFSGAGNVSDQSNQKIYELFFDYKGHKIRVAVIFLHFFSSSASISIKLAD